MGKHRATPPEWSSLVHNYWHTVYYMVENKMAIAKAQGVIIESAVYGFAIAFSDAFSEERRKPNGAHQELCVAVRLGFEKFNKKFTNSYNTA